LLKLQYQDLLHEFINKIENEDWKLSEQLPTITKSAEKYKVSTSMIREIYKSLEVKGYISIEQGRGCFLKDSDPDKNLKVDKKSFFKLLKLTELRIMIEPSFAAEAAKNAFNEDIEKINDSVLIMKEIAKNNDPTHEVDLSFHKLIVEATHNEYAISMYENLQSELKFMHSFAKKKEMVDKAVHYHQMIASSIANRNYADAKMYMESHLKVKNTEILMYESSKYMSKK